jgi:hypothetical protein
MIEKDKIKTNSIKYLMEIIPSLKNSEEISCKIYELNKEKGFEIINYLNGITELKKLDGQKNKWGFVNGKGGIFLKLYNEKFEVKYLGSVIFSENKFKNNRLREGIEGRLEGRI